MSRKRKQLENQGGAINGTRRFPASEMPAFAGKNRSIPAPGLLPRLPGSPCSDARGCGIKPPFENFVLQGNKTMSRVCQVTGKKPQTGNNVSHANNKTKRRFLPNLRYKRIWVESENRWVRLRLTRKGLRIIDKKGIDVVLAEMRARGEAV